MFGGDPRLFVSAVRAFAACTPSVLDKLGSVTEDTLGDYGIVVHGLKGSCSSIGADELVSKALYLEKSANDGNVFEVLNKNDDLLKNTRFLIACINDTLKEHSGKTDAPIVDSPDPALMARLRDCCTNYDIGGVDDALEEIDEACYEHGEELIAKIKEHVMVSEFEEASALITGYLGG